MAITSGPAAAIRAASSGLVVEALSTTGIRAARAAIFPYFLAVGLIAELSMLGKDTYRNPLRTRIGWTINCVGNFVGCAVPLWWAWDSYTAMALESGFTSDTLEMQMAMVTSPALMLLGVAITAVLTFLGTLFGQRLLRKHFQKAGIVG